MKPWFTSVSSEVIRNLPKGSRRFCEDFDITVGRNVVHESP